MAVKKIFLLSYCLPFAVANGATLLEDRQTVESPSATSHGNCFPALGFQMPSRTPDDSDLRGIS